jgi:MSHA biogenesis protein MshN
MVERAIMSIINKMHQELQGGAASAPILASMPAKKHKQKVLLFCLISLLLISSIGLSYLIYSKPDNREGIAEIIVSEVASVPVSQSGTAEHKVVSVTTTSQPIVITPSPVKEPVQKMAGTAVKKVISSPVVKVITTPKPKPLVAQKKVTQVEEKQQAKVINKTSSSFLEIKKSTLTKQQLADIHLKKAQKALENGDTFLASQEKSNALSIKPELHEVRKSLALYYYGAGDQNRAASLLKKGALQFPEYSDFNLMLSRIALKNGETQKAYLYLDKHPPKVEGHLDYHVSYAILAQKYERYEKSETLYQGLLSQRPNNGRWIMSLAIAQDKQSKQSLAVASYQKALLQIDLSSKAKKYINQRLTYLARQ